MKKSFFLLAIFFASLCAFSYAHQDNVIPNQESNTVDKDKDSDTDNGDQSVYPLFVNSIASTSIDFITEGDTNAFMSIQCIGQDNKEMPDSRTDNLFDIGTYIFEVNFSNGERTEIWVHSSFGSQIAAEEYATKLTGPLGKLPDFMRNELSHVVVHKGDANAFAEADANFFVVYSSTMDLRIGTTDLEETIFHESVHATLDAHYLDRKVWLQAQQADNSFITHYARDNASKEDMAESALFAYTMIKHPGRLSPEIETWVTTNLPNRFAFFQTIFN